MEEANSVAIKPHNNWHHGAKTKFSLPKLPLFVEMSASFLIHWFGSVGRGVTTSEPAECIT